MTKFIIHEPLNFKNECPFYDKQKKICLYLNCRCKYYKGWRKVKQVADINSCSTLIKLMSTHF